MKITDEKLKNDLVEMYTYYFKRSVEESEGRDLLSEVTPEQAWNIGKCDGAVEALGAIMLQIFGGQMMFEIWQKTMKWANGDEDE